MQAIYAKVVQTVQNQQTGFLEISVQLDIIVLKHKVQLELLTRQLTFLRLDQIQVVSVYHNHVSQVKWACTYAHFHIMIALLANLAIFAQEAVKTKLL